ncbi:hypothetical protein N658DRAFT_525634 [Parathielavia hyrcaniae]|uniref:BHLH domain-containing protein n=1 Tax=Parathielavia hyrcaniae TaxID=113614 RepID=A0AAN6PWQ4_9PEZI|nr:hypothetical protein N658DRAFT_525634 [Parathielavia hyrcaniae]
MQAAAPAHLMYNPDPEDKESFPERHLDDDVVPPSGIGPEAYNPAVTASQMFQPNVVPLPSYAWPGQHQPFLSYGYPQFPSHHQLVGATQLSAPKQQAMTPLHAEWASLREQDPLGPRRLAPQSECTVGDDFNSVPSPAGGPDELEFCAPLRPTLSSQNPRLLSTQAHHMARPADAPGTIIPSSFQPTARSGRPYIPDFDYTAEWPDPSDANSGFFTPQPAAHENAAGRGPELLEIAHHGGPASFKVDSKRVAHMLSEKSRRNRLTIAIREIQKLLPSEIGGNFDKNYGDDDGESPASRQDAGYTVQPGVPSSKLDIAEMAVGFIKDLKEKNTAMKKRIRELEKKMEGCQCRHGHGRL